MRVEFSVSGDVQLNRDILRVSDRALDMRPAFTRVLDLWRAETGKQFDTEGRHASGGWTPLAVTTMIAKRRHGLRPEILRATDTLMRSLTEAGDPNEIARVTPGELDYGSKVPYAKFHQLGTGRMPQRRPVAFSESTRRETIKIIQRYVIAGSVT